MSLARLVITAVVVERRSQSAVARDYGLLSVLGPSAGQPFPGRGRAVVEPRSRRPRSDPRSVSLDVEDQIVRLRKTLTKRV